MKNRLVLEEWNVRDVMDVLSELSEIDVVLEMQKGKRSEDALVTSRWLNPDQTEENEEVIKSVFRMVYDFLDNLADRDPARLKEPLCAKGVYALMGFVFEAVEKINKYTLLFKHGTDVQTVLDLKEYRDLHEFHASSVAFLLPPAASLEDQWEGNWGVKSESLTDIRGMCLRNISQVQSDQQYELLYILNENGQPFYDYEVLRHSSMLYDVERILVKPVEDALFEKIEMIRDRECHHRAVYILKSSHYLVDEFFVEAFKYKESLFIVSLIKAVMALMLSANPRNLKQTSLSGKTAYDYFCNFQYYLRQALDSQEYQKLIMASSDSRPFHATLYVLVHKLCTLYFTCDIDHKEMSAIVRRLVSEGGDLVEQDEETALSMWSGLRKEDRGMRHALEKYPPGAIHKLAKVFESRQNVKGFDPLSQQYVPDQLFVVQCKQKSVGVLRMPCPIHQQVIQKAVLVKEFEGFIRACRAHSTPQKILLINLQSRISWLEFARCIALEELSRKEEFAVTVSLLGLSKTSDFYHQEHTYRNQEDSVVFIENVKQQIDAEELCGFYFSQNLAAPIKSSLSQTLSMIHEMCFEGREILKHAERCDFIEITYLFMTLFALHQSEADFISFIDKDSVDLASVGSAEWFGLCKLLSNKPLTEEEKSFFFYLLHSQALIHRERGCDPIASSRMLTALDRLHTAISTKKKLLQKYFTETGLSACTLLIET